MTTSASASVSHAADWFTPEDAEKGRVIAAVLAPALIAATPHS